jgi:hypothetical protein
MAGETVGELLGRCLRAADVQQVVGDPIPGIRSHPVPDPALARALADADGRLGPGPGCAFLPGQTLHVSTRPGASPEAVTLTSVELLPAVVARAADWANGPGSTQAAAFVLDLDLDAPAPAGAAPAIAPPLPPGALPDCSSVDGPILVFAGHGVLRRHQVDAVRRLANRAGIGVSNSWGAKGLFEWDDPHHLGTVGLQARDYELGGFADAALIIGIGVDEDESPWARWALSPMVQVAPDHVDALTSGWTRPPQDTIAMPPLFDALTAVCMPSYRSDRFPLHPGRAIIETKQAMAPGDRVAADPGGAIGMWVARAFPTSELGSVIVPATVADDFAVTAAVAGALRASPVRVLAVTDRAESAALDHGHSAGVSPTVLVWGDTGDIRAAGELAERVARGGVIRVPVDLGRNEELHAAAGPVIAWDPTP